MNLRRAHRISGAIVGGFVTVHLLNHLTLLDDFERHIKTMQALRLVYRFPPVEIALLAAIALQLYSGLRFVVTRWRQRQDRWRRAQLVSGIYLAFFFINHVGATLFARTTLKLDTNIFFASAGMHRPPFQYFFAPYYFLAVSAFFVHIACLIRISSLPLARHAPRWLPAVLLPLGPALGLLIVAAQAGVFYPVTIPTEYRVAFEKLIP